MYRYEQPIKRQRSSKYGCNYWTFWSRKVRRNVAVFSNLEYENLLTLEMEPEVEWYCEYPMETTAYVGGKEEAISFDVWVYYADGHDAFQGVSYSKDDGYHKETAFQAKWCTQNGLHYEHRSEKNIHNGKFFIRNLAVLAARARRFETPSITADQMVIGFLSEIQRDTIDNLSRSGRFEDGRTLDYLADLYYRGKVSFHNISHECLSGGTEVIYIGK